MRRRIYFPVVILILTLLITACASSGSAGGGIQININTQRTGHDIAGTFYGIFYEDINYAADGGMYPELVRNRSFEYITPDPKPVRRSLIGWLMNYNNKGAGTAEAASASPMSQTNPTYVAVNVIRAPYIITNRGFAGSPDMIMKAGASFNFYFYARVKSFTGQIVCNIEDSNGNLLTNTVNVTLDSHNWKKYGPFVFTAAKDGRGLLSLRCEGTGEFDLDFVSVMPQNTWGYGKREWPHGGLRADLVQVIADLKPGFFRFPGGCIVEGAHRHETAYHWKNTIGPVEQRRENSNLWGYMMSYGLGFHEYFQLCRDIGAEPIPVLYAGVLCQARVTPQHEPDLRPGQPAFDQLVQDYLDLIEYANGAVSTTWGAKRTANGSPEPFNMKYIGVGNENWGGNYWRNFKVIREKILAVYPNMQIVTTSGPLSDLNHPINQEAWQQINSFYKDSIVDEHYYNPPSWFLENTRRYDSFLRNGVRVFVGEYAAHESNRDNTWYSALTEAAYITGMERNADIVVMASYAPLFARDQMMQWRPDLIWFDSEKVTKLTPNYQIQKTFANNVGTKTLPPERIPPHTQIFHASSIDESSGIVYTKLVNPFARARTVTLNYENLSAEQARMILLSGKPADLDVAVTESTIQIIENSITLIMEPYSTAILRIK